jgi:hypothetical protein
VTPTRLRAIVEVGKSGETAETPLHNRGQQRRIERFLRRKAKKARVASWRFPGA